MIGAILGDIAGSIYERSPVKSDDFNLFSFRCKFTDDTVLSVAIASAILNNKSYKDELIRLGKKYRGVSYGDSFYKWLHSKDHAPYCSYGNGSAMRVSAIGYLFDSEEEVINQAQLSAKVTHNHDEGIKGAKAIALCVFMARTGHSKNKIRDKIICLFGYDLNFTVESIKSSYAFNDTCQGSVPQSIVCFLDANSYEQTLKNAILLRGDSDTIACMSGGIAGAFYGVPSHIKEKAIDYLPAEFLEIINQVENLF